MKKSQKQDIHMQIIKTYSKFEKENKDVQYLTYNKKEKCKDRAIKIYHKVVGGD